MARSDAQELADGVPVWFHSIDLGGGVVTPGRKGGGEDYMRRELEGLRLPDLSGKSVLDIGAWDGFYAFEAERRGASRVVALDRYVWELDIHGPPPSPGPLPGKRGFDAAHRALGSSVDAVVGEFMELDPAELGRFDVVFFLGFLYHLEEPLAALRRLASVTTELALIETAAVEVAGLEDRALWEFYGADELDGDATNWWAPNAKALESACLAAGFREVEITDRYRGGVPAPEDGMARLRLSAHARK